ncbi:extracellular solute-binding protein [Cohnella luojiensis]|uniref:Extracellular solute-binding protein n=1 Tax=Cohnella luojiensis TaxID=652876 RepID=A0A4Y8LXF3_9BACL|nr:extracellular solute-binding protein [Cohnella luojiensis]TFE26643.1 extracellular solute-binding protein [Cohnella luojiensis]
MKKRVSGLLALVLIISVIISACSGSKNEPSASQPASSGSAPASESAPASQAGPVDISVFAVQENGIDLPTNKFTKHVEEKFNIKFKFETVPSDGAKEKRQISLASGDYPDAYILTAYVDQFSQADLLKFGQQGVLIPLNDLIDKYAPNIKAALDSNADFKAFATAPDGKVYGLPAYAQCFHCSYPNKLWLNTKWLEKVGLPQPKTPEDFKKVLEAFKNDDPNGNGKKDEVPLSGSTEDFGVRVIPYLMNAFVYDDDRNHLNLTNGKVESAAIKPEWKQGLAYIKSLYDEGLIDPGAFTQNAEAFSKIGKNADAQILGAGAGMHPAIFIDVASSRDTKEYNPLPPLTGPGGVSYATHDGGGVAPGAKFAITNKASEEAQIALIKMVDYMFTPEGQTNGASGMKGIDWEDPAPGDMALGEGVEPKVKPIPGKEGEEPRNATWSGVAHFYMPREYRDSWVQGTDIYDGFANYERRLYQATQLYEGHEPKELFPIWALWIDPADSDEANILQTNIKTYIDENSLQFVTGSKSLDKDWDSYVNGLEDLKLDRYLEILQKAYDASAK